MRKNIFTPRRNGGRLLAAGALAAALALASGGCGDKSQGEGPGAAGDSRGRAKPVVQTPAAQSERRRPKTPKLPPALPRDLTPLEARAQTDDLEALVISTRGRDKAPVDAAALSPGYIRLIATAAADAPPPVLAIRRDDEKLQRFGPASRLPGESGEARWEYFLVNDPSRKMTLEFVNQ